MSNGQCFGKNIYINRILSTVADNIGSGIADIYGELYYYNRSMWVNMSEQTASNFISLIAQKAGLYNSFVSNFKVKKNMYKQLNADLLVRYLINSLTRYYPRKPHRNC